MVSGTLALLMYSIIYVLEGLGQAQRGSTQEIASTSQGLAGAFLGLAWTSLGLAEAF